MPSKYISMFQTVSRLSRLQLNRQKGQISIDDLNVTLQSGLGPSPLSNSNMAVIWNKKGDGAELSLLPYNHSSCPCPGNSSSVKLPDGVTSELFLCRTTIYSLCSGKEVSVHNVIISNSQSRCSSGPKGGSCSRS